MAEKSNGRREARASGLRRRAWIAGYVLTIRARQLGSLAARARRKLTGAARHRDPEMAPRSIPRIVWIYWDGGEAHAPEIVRACIASWRRQNPGWQVRVLSAADATAVGDLPAGLAERLPVQSLADLLRLRLLRRDGGVWADATLYCVTPLDHWLPPLVQKGFFAFSWTEADRWMIWPDLRRDLTNWFIASEPEGTVIATWETHGFAYWAGRSAPHVYYWPHILIDWLRLSDRRFARALAEMPRLGCYAPHLVHDCLARGGDPAAVRGLLEAGVAPVQKLRRNWDSATAAKALAILPEAPASAITEVAGAERR